MKTATISGERIGKWTNDIKLTAVMKVNATSVIVQDDEGEMLVLRPMFQVLKRLENSRDGTIGGMLLHRDQIVTFAGGNHMRILTARLS